MDVSDLRISELEFHSAEAVGMHRNVRPPRHFVFEFLVVK
jgi:hypothetical protein